ncbi:MAG TPA: response regulator [Chloroflexota bacterium]|nr:response regulator [Chloroflexota bacterium]
MATRRILVIDDEDDIREVAKASLELVGGWDVVAAGSGQEGIDKASREQPDAILLDVMMPDLDGPTTYQMLQCHADTQNIPVIFLTAKVQSADRRHLTGLGAAAMIAKPFDPLALAGEVGKILGWER